MRKHSIVAILFLLATITIPLCALQAAKQKLPVKLTAKSFYDHRIPHELWAKRRAKRKKKKVKTINICSAAENNDRRWVQQQKNNNPDFVAKIEAIKNKNNKTGLHITAEIDNQEMAAVLSKSGIDISATDTKGNTALHTAALHENFKVYNVLARQDANLSHITKNKTGKTADNLFGKYQPSEPLNKAKYALAVVGTWVSNFIHAGIYVPPSSTEKPSKPSNKTSSILSGLAWFKSTFDNTLMQHAVDHVAVDTATSIVETKSKVQRLIIESDSDESSSSESEAEDNFLQQPIEPEQRQEYNEFYQAFRKKAGYNFKKNKKLQEYFAYLKQMSHHRRMCIIKNKQTITPDSVSIPSYAKKSLNKEDTEIKISKKPTERPIDHFANWVLVRSLQLLNFLWKNKYTGPIVDNIINKQVEKASEAIKKKIESRIPIKKVKIKKEKDNSSDESEYETANVIHIDLNINKTKKKQEQKDFRAAFITKMGKWYQYPEKEHKEIKAAYLYLKAKPHIERMNIITRMKFVRPGFSHCFKEEEESESEESEESDEELLLPGEKGKETLPGECYSDDETLQKINPKKEVSKKPGFFGEIINRVTDALVVDVNLDNLDLTGAVPGVAVTPKLKKQEDTSQNNELNDSTSDDVENAKVIEHLEKDVEKLLKNTNKELPLNIDDLNLKPIKTTFIVKVPVTNTPSEKLATQIDVENSEVIESSEEDSDNNEESNFKEKELLEFEKTFWDLDIDSIPADNLIQLTEYYKQIGVLSHKQRMQKLKLNESNLKDNTNKLECFAVRIRNEYQPKVIKVQSNDPKELKETSDEKTLEEIAEEDISVRPPELIALNKRINEHRPKELAKIKVQEEEKPRILNRVFNAIIPTVDIDLSDLDLSTAVPSAVTTATPQIKTKISEKFDDSDYESDNEESSSNEDNDAFGTCSEPDEEDEKKSSGQSIAQEPSPQEQKNHPTTWTQSFVNFFSRGEKFSNEHKTIM